MTSRERDRLSSRRYVIDGWWLFPPFLYPSRLYIVEYNLYSTKWLNEYKRQDVTTSKNSHTSGMSETPIIYTARVVISYTRKKNTHSLSWYWWHWVSSFIWTHLFLLRHSKPIALSSSTFIKREFNFRLADKQIKLMIAFGMQTDSLYYILHV